MTKLIPLILAALSLVACGGEPFDAANFAATGGDSGEAGAADTAGASSAGSGGAAHTGGSASTAGKTTGGAPSAGGQPMGGTGGTPASCEFDESKLTAALPMSLVWEDFLFTNGPSCIKCVSAPCDSVNVISWGVPTMSQSENEFVYNPNTDLPMVSVTLGTNDGMCTPEKICGAKLAGISATITIGPTVNGFAIVKAVATAQFSSNQCFPGGGAGETGQMGVDLGKEISAALQSLEIPCN